MKLVRLTPQNVNQYIGYKITFTSRCKTLIKHIISASNSGKCIKIEHADLNNCLQIVSRKVYVLV